MNVVLGEPFTFQVLFLDSNGDPFVPTSATISIFYYADGEKITLVDDAALTASTPAEPGRYVYSYTFVGDLNAGTLAYVEARGVHPLTTAIVYVDSTIDLVSRSMLSPTGTLRARFVR